MTGVTEDALKEFSMMFKHFDKDKTGRLEHHEFKSCLRSLGYDLPMVDEGEEDPEFQAILDAVDPNRFASVVCFKKLRVSKSAVLLQILWFHTCGLHERNKLIFEVYRCESTGLINANVHFFR